MVRLSPQRWTTGRARPGLAFGWAGCAWVSLHQTRALGLDDRYLHQAIGSRLRIELATSPPGEGISPFIGCGAAPLVAALALTLDRGHRRLLVRALRRWEVAARISGETALMTGSAGALLACAEIEALAPGSLSPSFVRLLHRATSGTLNDLLEAARTGPVVLGMAFGIAGYLLALEAGRAVFGLRHDASPGDRAVELLVEQSFDVPGGGWAWAPRSGDAIVRMNGWCNGAAGIGLALLACHALSGRRAYSTVALRALQGAASIATTSTSICCGDVGRAHIFIEAYRLTGGRAWLANARRLARTPRRPRAHAERTLFHGRAGDRYLGWRLRAPTALPFPGLGPLSARA